MPDDLLPVAVAIAAVVGFCVAVHRFVRRQRRLGKWNESGPIHPTPPPPDWGGARLPASLIKPPSIEHE